jgi:hypothetical protein
VFALSKTTIHWNQIKKRYKTKNNQRKTLKKNQQIENQIKIQKKKTESTKKTRKQNQWSIGKPKI